MARNQFQDIKKTEKYSSNKFIKKPDVFIDSHKAPEIHSNDLNANNNSRSRHTLWLVALVSVIFLFFALSFMFSKATVNLKPKIKTVSLNQNLVSLKDSNSDQLGFNVIILSDEESKLIKSGEEKEYTESAKGKVLIYNKFSSQAQALLVDTRLEGSNGKIYKTKTKVMVPGIKKDGNPGVIGVDIYGEEPGSEYNSMPMDFKIIGFKGTSKYSKFEVRSVGEISGGIIGRSRLVSEEQKNNAKKELKTTLEDKLYKKAVIQTQNNFILFKGSNIFQIDDESFTPPDKDGSVTLTTKATFTGFFFDRDKLTKKIIDFLVPDNDGTDIYISNLEDLTFTLSNKQNMFAPEEVNLSFNLYGVPKIIYRIDSSQLASDLVGKKKKDFNSILLNYSNIESAELSIKPIWKSNFPDDIGKIRINIDYP